MHALPPISRKLASSGGEKVSKVSQAETLQGLIRKGAILKINGIFTRSEHSPQSIAKNASQVSINKRRLPFHAGFLETGERFKTEKKPSSYQNLL